MLLIKSFVPSNIGYKMLENSNAESYSSHWIFVVSEIMFSVSVVGVTTSKKRTEIQNGSKAWVNGYARLLWETEEANSYTILQCGFWHHHKCDLMRTCRTNWSTKPVHGCYIDFYELLLLLLFFFDTENCKCQRQHVNVNSRNGFEEMIFTRYCSTWNQVTYVTTHFFLLL